MHLCINVYMQGTPTPHYNELLLYGLHIVPLIVRETPTSSESFNANKLLVRLPRRLGITAW